MNRLFLTLSLASSLALQAIPSALYVATDGAQIALSYNVDLTTGLLKPNPFFPVVNTSTGTYAMTITHDSTSAYITSGNLSLPGAIYMFSIDPTTGYLFSKNPATAPSTGTNFQTIVSPADTFCYTIQNSASRIGIYSIDPISRVLTQTSSSPVNVGYNVTSCAMTPDGTSMYVASSTTSDILMYDVNLTTGDLTLKSPSTISAGSGQSYITVSPDGAYAYVATLDSGSNYPLYVYSIDQTTGQLTMVDHTIQMGSFSFNLAISPNGKNLYVVQGGLGGVKNYLINPSPTPSNYLTLQGTATTGGFPKTVGFTLDSKFAFVGVSDSGTPLNNGVHMFLVDQTTGNLTPNNPAVEVMTVLPSAIAVTPAVPVVEVVNTAKALGGNIGGQFGVL